MLLVYACVGSGMSSGVNFAIPIDLVYEIVPALIVQGTIYSDWNNS